MNIHEHTCPAYRPPSLNMFKPAHMYRIHVSSLFTHAYRYAIHVLRTCMQYRYAIHVSGLFTRAYRYCVPVHNTGTQYMLQLCLHVRTGTQYWYCNTGIAYRYARVNIVIKGRWLQYMTHMTMEKRVTTRKRSSDFWWRKLHPPPSNKILATRLWRYFSHVFLFSA